MILFSFKFKYWLRSCCLGFIVTNQKVLHVFVTKPMSLEEVMSDRDSENEVDDEAEHLKDSQVYIFHDFFIAFIKTNNNKMICLLLC